MNAPRQSAPGPVVLAFPVQIPPGFAPSDLDADGVDLGPAGKPCAGYGGDFRPRWGGGFDAPRGPQGLAHRAIDIMAAEGALVVAPATGVVRSAGWSEKGGWHVFLDAADRWVWYLAHLRDEPLVRTSERVEAGATLGYVGRSGNAVRKTREGLRGCPHLHLSLTAPHWRRVLGPDGQPVARRGEKVDAVPFLRPLYEAGGWRA